MTRIRLLTFLFETRVSGHRSGVYLRRSASQSQVTVPKVTQKADRVRSAQTGALSPLTQLPTTWSPTPPTLTWTFLCVILVPVHLRDVCPPQSVRLLLMMEASPQ